MVLRFFTRSWFTKFLVLSYIVVWSSSGDFSSVSFLLQNSQIMFWLFFNSISHYEFNFIFLFIFQIGLFLSMHKSNYDYVCIHVTICCHFKSCIYSSHDYYLYIKKKLKNIFIHVPPLLFKKKVNIME